MKMGDKSLVVVGDRVLVKQEDLEQRTEVGLYLPQTVVEKEEVQGGRIVCTGPGIPLPLPQESEDEPWKTSIPGEPRYLPMQAEIGDYALFLKKSAIEIKFEGDKYLIVPHGAILVLIQQDEDIVEGIQGLEDLDSI
jgi:chaperonin GroES